MKNNSTGICGFWIALAILLIIEIIGIIIDNDLLMGLSAGVCGLITVVGLGWSSISIQQYFLDHYPQDYKKMRQRELRANFFNYTPVLPDEKLKLLQNRTKNYMVFLPFGMFLLPTILIVREIVIYM